MSEEFRSKVRLWLEENCPLSMRTPLVEAEQVWGGARETFVHPDSKIWFDRMVTKAWIVPDWPKEYGGAGLSSREAQIIKDEMKALGCRPPLLSFGIWMLSPVLLQFGTEEQKRRFLPPIARGEIRWCQGYSEPEAGSDLAGLQTRAERVGSEFIVNGSKVWTSYADQSDWIFCLVRTNASGKPQAGISFLLIDMNQPGIKVEPIRLISGKSPFCEVFFTNAQAPESNLVGPLNGGWKIAKELLTHERQGISEAVKKTNEVSLEDYACEKYGKIDGRLANAAYRDRLASYLIDDHAFRLATQRVSRLQESGQAPGSGSSFFKYYGTELNKRKYELRMEAAGLSGLGWSGGEFPQEDLDATREWLRSKGNSIEGGTSEIQLNIIAKLVLNLP